MDETGAQSRIFISYRREETAYWAGRLFKRLVEHFGVGQVFKDIDSIAPGDDFVEVITEAVGSCDVLLVLIGSEWLTITDDDGKRRIDNPTDFVRLEIEAALKRDVPVVPVLIDGARMPRNEELPGSLAQLSHRNALELSSSRFEFEMSRLLKVLDRLGQWVAPATTPEPATTHPPAPSPVRRQTHAAAPRRAVTDKGTLSHMFRQAALAGVFPATTSRYVHHSPGVASESPVAASESTGRGPWGWAVATVAIMALGGLATAKWVFGWLTLPIDDEAARLDDVQCTVFAPPLVAPGMTILVQVFVHLPEETDDARAIAMELDLAAQRRAFRSLQTPIPVGSRLDFELRIEGLEIDDSAASLTWQRRTEAVQFGVRVPPTTRPGSLIGTVSVTHDGIPIGHVKFALEIGDGDVGAAEPQGVEARRYRFAFVSYASQDRDEVLRRVQMLPVAGIQYFQDLFDLEPGEVWSTGLEEAIQQADVFLLFWSSRAKESVWVRREVDFALARKAGDDLSPPEIRPVIIEGPPVIPPWDDLAHLHFNDRVLYFMKRPR